MGTGGGQQEGEVTLLGAGLHSVFVHPGRKSPEGGCSSHAGWVFALNLPGDPPEHTRGLCLRSFQIQSNCQEKHSTLYKKREADKIKD